MGVLIVEDSAFQARILAELLKPIGTAIFVAATVKEAFDILQTVQVSLIISDLHMPTKKDGLDFIAHVNAKRQGEWPVELFVCTADTKPETREELNTLGVRRIFTKPYDANLMLQSVREIFWCTKETEDTLTNFNGLRH